MGQARGKPVDGDRHAGNRDRGGGGTTRPGRTGYVSVRCPGICQCPVRGRGAARRCRVGRRRRTRDAIARAVLGDDQRARLARSCGASAGRRTGAGADSGKRHCEGERVREGRHGEGRGHGEGRLDTRLRGLRLRIRLTAEFRMQQAVLIHAPGREPPLLNKSFGDKRFYASLDMARRYMTASPNLRMRHLLRRDCGAALDRMLPLRKPWEPNKINASTPYDFHGKNLTPYGGLLPVATMLEKLGFQSLLEETLTVNRVTKVMGMYQFFLGIVLGIYLGFSRLNQLRFIAQDPLLTGILKVSGLLPQCTLWRFLAALHLNVAVLVLRGERPSRGRGWAAGRAGERATGARGWGGRSLGGPRGAGPAEDPRGWESAPAGSK